MRSKKTTLTNFSHVIYSDSLCLRPDNEHQLADYMMNTKPTSILARGAGLSYNDSCLNQAGYIIDTQRLNHLIRFDSNTGIAVCQSGVLFKDLFLLHPDFIPPVLPGTVHATIAGGIAHDVHGKNNHQQSSFGHHIVWIDLLINDKLVHCNREKHRALFHATIAGLGLTGIITRVGIRLRKASRYVQVENTRMDSLEELLKHMTTRGLHYDYQVAWLDLLSTSPRALLSLANHCEPFSIKEQQTHTVPKIPFCLLNSWNIKWFNRFFLNSKKPIQNITLEQFNNPLDRINHWNRLYGPHGLIQFQGVFDQENAIHALNHLLNLIRVHKATSTLAVLKLFTQTGEGLLSFCKPGFTLAVDFIHNEPARMAITAMNQYIAGINGRIYLAKDLFLNPTEYKMMYEHHQQFRHTLSKYHCSMNSLLGTRLEITQ